MKELKVRVTGLTPLLTHNNQSADPINKYAQAMKALTAKKNKTLDDHKKLGRIEWESGLYLQEGIIVMPGQNIDRCLREAAKKTKNGKNWQKGAFIEEIFCKLHYKGPEIKVSMNGKLPNPELDKYFDTFNFRSTERVGTATIVRTRPIFEDWWFEFTLQYDETIFDKSQILDILKTAGQYQGLCERRPRLGKFIAEVIKS